jgi:GTP-binding protein
VGEGQSFVVADIPGLIPGASQGAGLGLDFLRHVERTRVLVHVLDLANQEPGRDPLSDWRAINAELAAYRPELLERPQVVAANKLDVTGAEERLAAARPVLEAAGCRVFPVSAATGRGLDELVGALAALVLPEKAAVAAARRILPPGEVEYVGRTERTHLPAGPLRAVRDGEAWVVGGQGLDRLVQKADLANEEAVKHLQRVFRDRGLDDFLLAAGVRPGELVRIAGKEFYFEPQEDETGK